MTFTSEIEITELARRFETRTLRKSEWTHAAHLVVGVYYLYHHPFGVALNLVRDGIHWLNDAHGTPNTANSGYHETLTVFWLTKINDLMLCHAADPGLVSLANEVTVNLIDGRLPLKEYSRELLFSAEARSRFVEPDLARSPDSPDPSAAIGAA